MQQTRLDHWLKKRFAHVTRFYCNVLPKDMPKEAKVEESPDGSLSSHKFRVTTPTEQVSYALVNLFQLQGITFAAKVDEDPGFVSKLVNRPRRSATYDAIWLIGILATVTTAVVSFSSTEAFPKLLSLIQEWIAGSMS